MRSTRRSVLASRACPDPLIRFALPDDDFARKPRSYGLLGSLSSCVVNLLAD